MVDNRKKSQSIDNQFSNWLKKNDGSIKKKILLVNKIDCIEKVNLFDITKKINEIINFDETFFIFSKICSAASVSAILLVDPVPTALNPDFNNTSTQKFGS